MRLALGGGVAYNQHTNRVRSTIGDTYPAGDVSYTHAAVDGILKTHGVSIIGEVLYRDADQERQTLRVNGAPMVIEARSGWGAYLQGGVMVSPVVELNARAGRLMPAPGTSPAFVRTNEQAFGLSYYPREHNLKVQVDYTRLTAPVTPRTSQQVRAQLQLYF